MKKERFILIIMALSMVLSAAGQQKTEKEFRARPQDIPVPARQYIETFRFPGKVKWYVEEGLTETTIEAKTGKGENRYSIEFDTGGQFLDVEIEREWDRMDMELRERIGGRFGSDFSDWKIDKVQVQYSGDPDSVREHIMDDGRHGAAVSVKYEIVVDGKWDGRRELFEYTFSAAGDFEERKMIVQRRSDNLEY